MVLAMSLSRIKTFLYIIGIIMNLFCIPMNLINSMDSNQRNSLDIIVSTDPDSGVKDLAYGEYVLVDSGREKVVDFHWEFSSSKANIGIIVYGMDNSSYTYNFLLNSTNNLFLLSDGSKSSDSGVWEIDDKDMWCIVFLNNDTDMQSTSLTYSVEMYNAETPIIIFWAIVVMCLSILVPCTPLIVKRLKNRKEKKKEKLIEKKSKTFFDDLEINLEEGESVNIESTGLTSINCPFCSKEIKNINAEICDYCGSKIKE